MGATILIADDDHLHLKCLTHHLEKAGYSVIQATDSFHALRLASQLKPSLIILDINMPAGDGFSVKERLDKQGLIGNTPVIFLTAERSDRVAELAAASEAYALLYKPCHFNELLCTVRESLEHAGLREAA